MYKLLLSFLLLISFSALNAQSDDNCYLKWMKKFEERGGEKVEDGIYEDVIVTFRQGTNAQCYNGKAVVKDGKVIGYFLQTEDGKWEEVKKKLKYELDVVISNGVSKTIVTHDDELINIMWVKKLKPKKKGYVKAPDPGDD